MLKLMSHALHAEPETVVYQVNLKIKNSLSLPIYMRLRLHPFTLGTNEIRRFAVRCFPHHFYLWRVLEYHTYQPVQNSAFKNKTHDSKQSVRSGAQVLKTETKLNQHTGRPNQDLVVVSKLVAKQLPKHAAPMPVD